jgi:hypothetical protein
MNLRVEPAREQGAVTQPGTVCAARRGDAQPTGRAPPQRGVHKDTGLMEWLESKQPEVEGAPEWKYPLDTV